MFRSNIKTEDCKNHRKFPQPHKSFHFAVAQNSFIAKHYDFWVVANAGTSKENSRLQRITGEESLFLSITCLGTQSHLGANLHGSDLLPLFLHQAVCICPKAKVTLHGRHHHTFEDNESKQPADFTEIVKAATIDQVPLEIFYFVSHQSLLFNPLPHREALSMAALHARDQPAIVNSRYRRSLFETTVPIIFTPTEIALPHLTVERYGHNYRFPSTNPSTLLHQEVTTNLLRVAEKAPTPTRHPHELPPRTGNQPDPSHSLSHPHSPHGAVPQRDQAHTPSPKAHLMFAFPGKDRGPLIFSSHTANTTEVRLNILEELRRLPADNNLLDKEWAAEFLDSTDPSSWQLPLQSTFFALARSKWNAIDCSRISVLDWPSQLGTIQLAPFLKQKAKILRQRKLVASPLPRPLAVDSVRPLLHRSASDSSSEEEQPSGISFSPLPQRALPKITCPCRQRDALPDQHGTHATQTTRSTNPRDLPSSPARFPSQGYHTTTSPQHSLPPRYIE